MARPARAKRQRPKERKPKQPHVSLAEKSGNEPAPVDPSRLSPERADSDPSEEKPKQARVAEKAPVKPKVAPRPVSKPAGGRTLKGQTFVRDVRSELSRVTWPNREELVQATMVVLVTVVVAGAFLGALDAIFSRLLSFFLPTVQ